MFIFTGIFNNQNWEIVVFRSVDMLVAYLRAYIERIQIEILLIDSTRIWLLSGWPGFYQQGADSEYPDGCNPCGELEMLV